MENFVCKIANREEIEKRWEALVERHPNDDSWKGYREKTLDYFDRGVIFQYFGVLNGEIICECCAHIDKNGKSVDNCEQLIDDNRAYVNAFRCDKEYEGKGYFSVLYHYMEEDLKNRGFKELTIGVEPSEVRNIQIYFHFGFTEYVKTEIEKYLPEHEGEEGKEVYVNYYMKRL